MDRGIRAGRSEQFSAVETSLESLVAMPDSSSNSGSEGSQVSLRCDPQRRLEARRFVILWSGSTQADVMDSCSLHVDVLSNWSVAQHEVLGRMALWWRRRRAMRRSAGRTRLIHRFFRFFALSLARSLAQLALALSLFRFFRSFFLSLSLSVGAAHRPGHCYTRAHSFRLSQNWYLITLPPHSRWLRRVPKQSSI